MNTGTIQDDQQVVDLDLDEEFLAAIRGCNSPNALEALAEHRYAADRLVEARSDNESTTDIISSLEDDVNRARAGVISWAETDRAVDRLKAIHEEIKAERAIS